MILASLAVLALQTAAPDAATAAPAPAPATLAVATPNGAPSDDYGFVAWCRGALTGHMELYKAVKPEMARVEAEKAARQNAKLSGEALAAAKARQAKELKESEAADQLQLKAGREYVVLYGQALDAAEASAPESLHARGQQAIAEGYRIWAGARAAGDRDKMWSWLMWELPARCETAAKTLKANAGLFGDAYKSAAATETAPAAAPEAAPAATGDATSAADPSTSPQAGDAAAPPPSAAAPADAPVPALRPAEHP